MPETAESLSTADRALLRALRTWAGDDLDRTWSKFSTAWRDRLLASSPLASKMSPESAWDGLRRDHVASSRPDRARVHPSWYLRALRSESPAVRLAIAAHAPGPIREAVLSAFKIGEGDLATDRPPDPEALSWALSLWSERLVGDVSERPDDPPVVLALASLPPRELFRLFKVTGLVKHAFAIRGKRPSAADEAMARLSTPDRVRLGYFRRHVGLADPRLVPIAEADLKAMAGDFRRGHARLGLVTFGRLLKAAEPYRSRWATQHLPYPVAKLLKDKNPPAMPQKALVAWEDWVLEAAWTRLLVEGRLIGVRGGFA